MKSNKSVLLVSWSFPPIQSPRAIKAEAIVKGFSEKHSSVTLVTRAVSKNYLKASYPEVDVLAIDECKLDIFSFDINKSKRLSIDKFKRIFNGLLYKVFDYPDILVMLQMIRILKSLKSKEYDYLLSIDGPQTMHWAVAYLRWRKKLKTKVWIADSGDPLTRNLPGNMVAPYFKLVEDWFCGQADILTVPVQEGYTYFKSKFREKIRVVRHSLIFPIIAKGNKSGDDDSLETIHIAYAGNMMPYQKTANTFFKHLEESNASYVLHIYGNNDNLVNGIISGNRILLKKVHNHGLVERVQLLTELQEMDFLVYFPYHDTGQTPFKLIDYAFIGKPVLKYDHITKSNLDLFLSGDYSNQESLPPHKSYDYETTTANYIKLFESIE